MDAKTLSKMAVSKLREEAMKFDDLTGIHGMEKPELINILKEKYGISEEHNEPEELEAKRFAVKAKIRRLKAEKAQAITDKEHDKAALLRKRLHQQRHLLKKIVKLEKKVAAA